MTEISRHTKKDILEPIFWGLIVALISLPFYLALAVPQIGMVTPIVNTELEIGIIHIFLIPVMISFLASALLGEREMMSGMVMMVSGAVFLTLFLLFVLLLPQMLGAVYFMDMYYIDIAKKMMVAFIMFFPSLLVGGVIGRVFGDAYVSDTSRSERKKLNEEMREWKKTLERAIMDSERGNVSGPESAETPERSEMGEKATENADLME